MNEAEKKTTVKKVRKTTSSKKEDSTLKETKRSASKSQNKTVKKKTEKKKEAEKKVSTPKKKKTISETPKKTKEKVSKTVKVENDSQKQPVLLEEKMVSKEISNKKEEIVSEEKVVKKENDKENNFRTSEVVILIIITCFVSVIMGALITRSLLKDKSNPTTTETSSELQELIDNYTYIKKNYEDKVTERELVNGAINGMLEAAGDPYAGIIEKDSRLMQELNGSLYGIGVEIINNEDGNIEIYNAFENGPAKRAGLEIGDIIDSIDGVNLTNQSTTVFANYVKESNKTEFEITFTRDSEKKTVTVKKEYVVIPSVFSDMFERNEKKVGYLQVTIFSATTYNQFKEELEKLEKENIDSLIIDVRGNSGGRLDAALDMISLFLDSSHVICQEESNGETYKYYSTGRATKTYPIAVLVDGSSASASEVLTAALKEEYGASIVGTTTFGKGTSQQVKTLANGDEYKITTKKWLTPSGEWVNGVGIKPTNYVELDSVFYENPSIETDNQLQSAIDLLSK